MDIKIPLKAVIDTIVTFGDIKDDYVSGAAIAPYVIESYNGNIPKLRNDIIDAFFIERESNKERTISNFIKEFEEEYYVLYRVFGIMLWIEDEYHSVEHYE
jgi:hypothetical protein